MQALGDQLRDHAPEIIQLWRQVATEEPLRLPEDHDLGELPQIVTDLVEVSILQPNNLEWHQRKVNAAAAHGERRRAANVSEAIIYAEFSALREALRRYLESCKVPRWKHRDALMRLDMAISVSELAALRGYHRVTYEQMGDWSALLTRMARESPLMGLPSPH